MFLSGAHFADTVSSTSSGLCSPGMDKNYPECSKMTCHSSPCKGGGIQEEEMGGLHVKVDYADTVLLVRVLQMTDILLPPAQISTIHSIFVRGYLLPDQSSRWCHQTEEIFLDTADKAPLFNKSSIQHILSPSSFRFDSPLRYAGVTARTILGGSLRMEVWMSQRGSRRVFLMAMTHVSLCHVVRETESGRYSLIPCTNITIPNSMRCYGMSSLGIITKSSQREDNPDDVPIEFGNQLVLDDLEDDDLSITGEYFLHSHLALCLDSSHHEEVPGSVYGSSQNVGSMNSRLVLEKSSPPGISTHIGDGDIASPKCSPEKAVCEDISGCSANQVNADSVTDHPFSHVKSRKKVTLDEMHWKHCHAEILSDLSKGVTQKHATPRCALSMCRHMQKAAEMPELSSRPGCVCHEEHPQDIFPLCSECYHSGSGVLFEDYHEEDQASQKQFMRHSGFPSRRRRISFVDQDILHRMQSATHPQPIVDNGERPYWPTFDRVYDVPQVRDQVSKVVCRPETPSWDFYDFADQGLTGMGGNRLQTCLFSS